MTGAASGSIAAVARNLQPGPNAVTDVAAAVMTIAGQDVAAMTIVGRDAGPVDVAVILKPSIASQATRSAIIAPKARSAREGFACFASAAARPALKDAPGDATGMAFGWIAAAAPTSK
jgi:hypothetical protein